MNIYLRMGCALSSFVFFCIFNWSVAAYSVRNYTLSAFVSAVLQKCIFLEIDYVIIIIIIIIFVVVAVVVSMLLLSLLLSSLLLYYYHYKYVSDSPAASKFDKPHSTQLAALQQTLHSSDGCWHFWSPLSLIQSFTLFLPLSIFYIYIVNINHIYITIYVCDLEHSGLLGYANIHF